MENSKNRTSKKHVIISYILRDLAICGGVAAIIAVMNLIFGGCCPLKLIFDLDCPFCGMTRAHIAALRFDFKTAFEFHSLFFLGLPYLFIISHSELFKGIWRKIHSATVITMSALFLIRYVIVLTEHFS